MSSFLSTRKKQEKNLQNKPMHPKNTFGTGVASIFGSMPMAEAFARIIPFLGQYVSKHSIGKASPETACARAFALSSKN